MAVKTFGGNLRAAREAAGITQSELAARLRFKRPTPISMWERTDHLPGPDTIRRIAVALNCAPSLLLQDVWSPYDELRGQTIAAQSDPDHVAGLRLSRDDVAWLELGRQLDAGLRRLHALMIAAQIQQDNAANALIVDDARFRRIAPPSSPASNPAAPESAGSSRSRRRASATDAAHTAPASSKRK